MNARGKWSSGPLQATDARVRRCCLARNGRQGHHQQCRKNGEGRWFDRPGGLHLSHQGPFLLQEQFGFRGQMCH